MGFDVKLDTAAAQELVQKAIFDSITEESRQALIQHAIEQMTLRPKKEYGYGSAEPRSPLEMAFDDAVRAVSFSAVRTYFDDEEIKTEIHDQIFAALDKLIADKGNWIYEQIGLAVGQKIAEVLGGEN